ncbi:hypothetical protein QYM36_010166 [Artemia franciscana]|uniref:Uncharacterized protein n=1 Tax=Artemia franciscana TaxID=6661 RepID=A0AA88L1G3_ARTSF|nr:hypothetical protein QYM36_010166 [Artemia franciscana]
MQKKRKAPKRLSEELRDSAKRHSDVPRQFQDQILVLSKTIEEKEQPLIPLWVGTIDAAEKEKSCKEAIESLSEELRDSAKRHSDVARHLQD